MTEEKITSNQYRAQHIFTHYQLLGIYNQMLGIITDSQEKVQDLIVGNNNFEKDEEQVEHSSYYFASLLKQLKDLYDLSEQYKDIKRSIETKYEIALEQEESEARELKKQLVDEVEKDKSKFTAHKQIEEEQNEKSNDVE